MPLGTLTVHWKRIVLALLALAILGGAVVYFGFIRIYKSDYSSMLRDVNDTTTTYNDLLIARDEAIGKLGADDKVFGGAVDNYRQKNTSYLEKTSTLSDARALRDAAVHTAYLSLTQQNAKFFTYVQDQLSLLPLAQGVVVNCSESAPSKLNTSDLGSIVTLYDEAMKPCSDAMVALATSDNATAATRAKTNVAYFDTMRSHATAMQEAFSAGNRAKFESEYNALLEALAQYKPHIQVRDLLAINKDTVPAAKLNALATILSERQR